MLQDLRHAIRTMRRSPLIAITAVLTLGLGIGGASAVFTVVEAVLLRPLPFHEPGRLVRIWELTRDGDRFSFSAPDYLDLRAQSRTLQSVAAFSDIAGGTALADGAEPERIVAVPVTASFSEVLGVRPVVGRMFTADEDRPGAAEHRIVLSNGLWQRRFGGDPQAVGRVVTLDGTPAVVTGVMPAHFDFPGGADAWVPLAADSQSDRGNHELAVIGRLESGATMAQLGGELRELFGRNAGQYTESHTGWSAEAIGFSEWIVAPRVRDAVWVLFGAVGVLLLLACANVASLLVAQAAAREGEMRIRAALGASPARIMRQLLTESLLLAVLGTGAAVLIAAWAAVVFGAVGGDRLPRVDELQVGGRVLAFACLAGILSCAAFGLAPALHAARVDLRSAMDSGFRYTSGGRRLRHSLVVVEIMLALLLLVGAGLLGNSFLRLTWVDPGFDTAGTIAMPVELPSSRYLEDRVAGFYIQALERVRSIPGVIDAAATATDPFRQFGFSNNVTPAERAAEAPPSGLVQAGWRSVTPRYFETMGIPVLSGRTFEASDRAGAERVVVVSETLARRLWPGEPAVGKRIYWGGTTGRTRLVIGVSGDIRDVRLDAEPPPILFLPHAQVDLSSMTIVVRSSIGIAAVAPALRDAIVGLDPALPAPPIHEISASRAEAVSGIRFNLSLMGGFAIIALVLAVTGVYAMLAFTVWERRREIAVRMALGATRPRIARLVLRTGMGLASVGVLAGTVAAFAAMRLLSSLLYGIEPTDPLTFTASALALLAVAAIASWLPARQASRVDPLAVLHE